MSLWVLAKGAWWLLTAFRLWWYGVYLKDNAILKTFKKVVFPIFRWILMCIISFISVSRDKGYVSQCPSYLVIGNSSWTNRHYLAFCLLTMKNLKHEGHIASKADGIFVHLIQRSYCKREGTKARNKCKAQIQSKDGSPSILAKLIQKN